MPGSEQMLQLRELHPWPGKCFLRAAGRCCPSGDSGASAAVGSRAEQAVGIKDDTISPEETFSSTELSCLGEELSGIHP